MSVAGSSHLARGAGRDRRERAVAMLNKVPEVTVYFWVIKVLCTTVGETAADFLSDNLGLGLGRTTVVMSVVLIAGLIWQFSLRRYVPGVYWLAVVLISIVGTLITDNLTDNLGVSLLLSTLVFAIALAVAFAVWYASERTLSIHTIVTRRREGFYWLAVLFTFALGTAAGDLVAERFSVGYWQSAVLFGVGIVVVYALHRAFGVNAILAFWLAYILTRPLGASIGDFLSQPRADGGLGLGTTVTSALFLLTILAVVVFLTVTRLDRTEARIEPEGAAALGAAPGEARVLVVANKVAVTSALVDAVRRRAASGPARFFLLVPNPAHVSFDRVTEDVNDGRRLLDDALPRLADAVEATVDGGVATGPNAYDDIVSVVDAHDVHEIILETPPTHVSDWLHIDLAHRIGHLDVPLTVVPAAV